MVFVHAQELFRSVKCEQESLSGIKQKKSHWASGINNSFLLLYCTQPRGQVWIFLIIWNWPIKTISSFKVVGVHFTKQISVTFCSYLHLLHFSASRARAWAWTRNGWISRYSLAVVLCKWYRPSLTHTLCIHRPWHKYQWTLILKAVVERTDTSGLSQNSAKYFVEPSESTTQEILFK